MDSDDSYVYDVYYQARAPVAGEEVIEAVGALSGLTAEDLMNEDSGESDSDKVMTDDEDSNGALVPILFNSSSAAYAHVQRKTSIATTTPKAKNRRRKRKSPTTLSRTVTHLVALDRSFCASAHCITVVMLTSSDVHSRAGNRLHSTLA